MHGDQQDSKIAIVYAEIRVRMWECEATRFNLADDHDDVIKRPPQNLGVDAYQSYQRKFAPREFLVEASLRLKRNRTDAQNQLYIRIIALAFVCDTSANAELEDASIVRWQLIALQAHVTRSGTINFRRTLNFAHIDTTKHVQKNYSKFTIFKQDMAFFARHDIDAGNSGYQSYVLHRHGTRCDNVVDSCRTPAPSCFQKLFLSRSYLRFLGGAGGKSDFNRISVANVDCRHGHQDSNARIASG